jgi:hypothetical protein
LGSFPFEEPPAREPHGDPSDDHAAGDADAQSDRRHGKDKLRPARRSTPHARQRTQDEFRVQGGADRAQDGASQREQESLTQKQSPHGLHPPAHRKQKARLRRALLDAEREQQTGEHRRRHDEEKGEVGEEFAEIHGRLGRRERLLAQRDEREAEGNGIDELLHRFDLLALRPRGIPNARQVAPAIAPHLLAHAEIHKRLRCAADTLPIIFIRFANALGFKRKPGFHFFSPSLSGTFGKSGIHEVFNCGSFISITGPSTVKVRDFFDELAAIARDVSI